MKKEIKKQGKPKENDCCESPNDTDEIIIINIEADTFEDEEGEISCYDYLVSAMNLSEDILS